MVDALFSVHKRPFILIDTISRWLSGGVLLLHTLLIALVDCIALLAYAVVLSGYERRCMAFMHNRDGPVAWGLAGLLQPLADGAKLLCKGVV